MAIFGLESDYYCAHSPIPIQVTPLMPAWNNMRALVRVYSSGYQTTAWMYQLNGVYYLDLSPWIKVHMNELRDQHTYSTTAAMQTGNPQVVDIEIIFVEEDPNSQDGDIVTQDVRKHFVQCSLYSGLYSVPPDKHVKLWRGYPYSYHNMQSNQILYAIPAGASKPVVSDWIIEYDARVCKGSYLKWLNEYGSYNYWFFPAGRDETDDASNIYDVNRSQYDPDKSSNYDSVGFDKEESFTVRDVVKEEYWWLFRSITSSPEVYILKDSWVDAFLGGATTLTPDYWIKVRQKDFSFDRTVYKRRMAEVEFEFEYPKPYTQKLI